MSLNQENIAIAMVCSAEYRFRFQNGPDPETIFHDVEAAANYVPRRSKFDSISRALGGGRHARRRTRGVPTPTPTSALTNAAPPAR